VSRQCEFRMPTGRLCAAAPRRQRPYCFLHVPEEAERAAEARRLGGNRRRHESTLETVYDLEGLDTPAGIRRVIQIAMTDALALDTGVARLRVLLAGATAATRLLETTDLVDRIAALEAVARRSQRATPASGDGGSVLDGSEK
jgi:hypothetical protein